jgi:hypothetical protein
VPSLTVLACLLPSSGGGFGVVLAAPVDVGLIDDLSGHDIDDSGVLFDEHGPLCGVGHRVFVDLGTVCGA